MSTRRFAAIGSRAEEPFDEFITADSKMRSHIAQNSGERPYFERVEIRNCNVNEGHFPRKSGAGGCLFAASFDNPGRSVPWQDPLPKCLWVISFTKGSGVNRLNRPTLPRERNASE